MKPPTRKINILFHFMRGRAAGGSDTCLFLLIKYLDKSKYEPYLLFRDKSIFVDQMEEIGIKLIPLSNRLKKFYYPTQPKIKSKNGSAPLKKPDDLRIFLGGLKNLIKRIPEIIWLIVYHY